MHLSRGHTNSDVISHLPFTVPADLKSITHLFASIQVNQSFPVANCQAYERQNVTPAGRCIRLLLGGLMTLHEEWHRALCQMLIHCRSDGGGGCQNTLKGKGLEMRRSINGASLTMMIICAFIKDQQRFEQCQKI